MVVLDAEGSGWIELNGLVDLLLLLGGEAAELRLEVCLLDAGRRQAPVQVFPDPR